VQNRCSAVGDVVDRDLGHRAHAPHVPALGLLEQLVAQRMSFREIFRPDVREHDQLVGVAVHQHLSGLPLDLGHRLRYQIAKLGYAEDVEAIAVEHVDVVAVGLDEVGLVDALFLVVGAGVVLAFLAAAALVGVGARRRFAGGVFDAAEADAVPVLLLLEARFELGQEHVLEVGLEGVTGLVLRERGAVANLAVVGLVRAAGRGREREGKRGQNQSNLHGELRVEIADPCTSKFRSH
jgi:hypothetical protein